MRADVPDPESCRDTSVPIADTSGTDHSGLSQADEHFGFGSSTPAGARGGGALAPGTNLGGVTIIRLIAEGGMGRVYEGRQAAPERDVAVKVLRGGFVSASLVRRFEYEARILARLRHPTIAQIFTFGTYHDGDGVVPFFVMEMVEAGRPITRHAVEARLGVREIVTLFRRVCAAVAHGHQKGVIHRDLKPGNILVDAAGEPKVIDFGVARSIGPDHGDPTQMTRAGDVVGTLRYMSPEQLGVGDGDVDARSDVYALGLVLHEALAGCLPYDLRGMSFVEAARVLDDPSPASMAAVQRAAEDAGCGSLDSRALATIVATCLSKRPGDRYATAVEVEAELGRWLAGEAILARPPTTAESLIRFARRNRATTAAAVAIIVTLIAATSGITFFYLRAERERRQADQARIVAERREGEAERQAAAARAQLYISNVLLSAAARDRDNVAEAERLLADARGLVGDAGSPSPIELTCLAASLDESVRAIGGHVGNVTAVGWSPDGTVIASGASDGAVRLGTRSGVAISWSDEPIGSHDDAVWSAAFSPDGRLLATASGDGSVRVWSVAGRSCIRELRADESASYAVAFAADGSTLATGGRDRTVRIWDASTWEQQRELRGHDGTVHAVSYSPDGTSLATAAADGTIRLWSTETALQTACLTGHEGRVFGVAFSPDGSELASAGDDGTARTWSVDAETERFVMRHPFRVNGVAWLEDGRRLATASHDGVLRVWDAATGLEHGRRRGHTSRVWSVAAVPTQGWVATGAGDGTMRIWDATLGTSPVMRGDDKVLSVVYSGDGRLIATAMANSVVRLWDAATLEPRGVLRKAVGRVNDVRFAPDGETVAGCCDDGTVQLWDRSSCRRRAWFKPHERRVYAIDFSPDGRLLATAAEDRSARIWDLAAGSRVGEPLKHGSRVFRATFSPDGTLLATACEDRTARLYHVADGSEVRRFEQHEGPVNWVAFSSDGMRLVTACSDGAARIWSVADGGLVSVMTGPARQIWKAAFSPDGSRVAAVSADGTAQVWDVATGRATPMLRGHTDQVWGVAFAPDGQSLATGSWDGTARVWGVSVAEIARRRTPASDR
ncbi:MAG: serine/threonine protein kinase [Planctomycetes bacterium]|nr:serine/threonine protein kinase [Planctomycetota bacterium]